jgi:syntaxin 18
MLLERAELASTEANPFLRLLPSRLRQDSTSVASANIAAHHASITYYLNRRLAAVGQFQKEMQEERIARQSERTRTLGSAAAREAAYLGIGDPLASYDNAAGSSSASSPRSWVEGAASKLGISTPSSSGPRSDFIPQQGPVLEDSEDEYDDLELTASQIQQFETENANILQSVQDKLAAVQQAESRLLEISALQTELVAHLTKQVEITDQLYEDAITTSETVEKGNVQLKEAKRRAKDSRLYILVFLFGASFALLFLHYY